MSDKARLEAYNNVKRILGGAYSNLLGKNENLSKLDRAFADTLTLGTLERKLTLEFILSQFIAVDTDDDIKALLMTGVYQIFYMDKVPESAACNETVKLATELFGKSKVGFVNAVMRNICRKRKDIEDKINAADGYIKYSVNPMLFDLIQEQYPSECERIFESFFGKTPSFLRVNTIKSNAVKVANDIGGRIITEKTVRCDNIASALHRIELGEFYVQGSASQKAVELLGAKPNETVIDVCACPGGKTLGAAIDMDNKGKILAFDLHEKKLSLIQKSAKRLGVTIIVTAQNDARSPKNELFGTADRVICDVPCSGTGVMGSKPEIKYKSPEEFCGLYETQRAIIAASSKYLKVGGVMVYSTCSINKNENEAVVSEFIRNNSNFRLIEERTYLPYEETFEGFYTAKIIREK